MAKIVSRMKSSSNAIPEYKKAVGIGMAIRVAAAPLVAWGLLSVLSVKGTLFSGLFVLASMPAAVNAVILAEEFDASPDFVSEIILWTTLVSFLELPLLLIFLK
jgi:predicted permease